MNSLILRGATFLGALPRHLARFALAVGCPIGRSAGGISLLLFAGLAAGAAAAPMELFVLWHGSGAWQCRLASERMTITRAEPYMFLDGRDRFERRESGVTVCTTSLRGHAAGVHVWAEVEPGATLNLQTDRGSARVMLADLPDHGPKVVPLADGQGTLIFGRGDPAPGPQEHYRTRLPPLFVPPTPRNPIALPADWAQAATPVRVRFALPPPGDLRVRRVAQNGTGLLFLEVHSPAGALRGRADVALGTQSLGSGEADGSFWLSLAPRLGRIALVLETPAGRQDLSVPTTLVEIRGPRLFLNGEPFLIKGTLPGELAPDDAEFIRSLGMNTLRGGDVLRTAELYGFMAIASIQGRKLKPLSDYKGESGRARLVQDMALNLVAETENGRRAADSPYALISQLDNERTTIGANPLEPEGNSTGADPWSDFLRGDESEFVRLNQILAEDWNAVKPLAPTLPLGYANETQGYLAPAFLDVYMHNSYLPRDRYGISFREFSRLQGGERRPFLNTEYGANRFTPEAYHGARNHPLLERLQAWGYRQTWANFMEAGTVGGTGYKLYDSTSAADQGTKSFGIMTADRQPKLACWELWHLWRDFEITPAADARSVVVSLRRDYAARECRLVVQAEGREWTAALGEFAPNAQRTVALPFTAPEFRWRLDYETHRGLKGLAVGAWPAALEEADFARRLAQRDAPEFLRTLLTARVLTAQGEDAPGALVDMTNADGVIPLAFRCADGTTYVTALCRRRSRESHYLTADIRTAFTGDVVQVDEWTGKPVAKTARHEVTASGIVFKDVPVPRIPGPIGQRADEPVSMPVFRITPRPPGAATRH